MNDRLKDAFDKIRAEEELKRNTQKYICLKMRRYNKKNNIRHYQLVTVMACFFLLLFGIGGYFTYFTSTSSISVDVNPSIELGINWFDKVISVEGYNEDGSELVASLDLKYLNYMDAIGKLLKDESMTLYLADEQLVSITVIGANEEKSEEMLVNVSSRTASSYGNITCSSGNSEEAAAAHAAGMSFGKYKAFLELQRLDPETKIEDIRGLSMCRIRDMIDALADNTEDSIQEEDNRMGRNGQGHGYGCGRGRRYRNGN